MVKGGSKMSQQRVNQEELHKFILKYNYEALELRRVLEKGFNEVAFVQRETIMRMLLDLEKVLK
jgi:hypothetical protein